MVYVYAVQHNKTKKMYIGTTKDVRKRYEQHITNLRSGIHKSDLMQKEFDEYGEDYSIYILEEIKNAKERVDIHGFTRTKRLVTEVEWMKRYNTITNGYNAQDYVAVKMIEKDKNSFPLKEGLPEVAP